MIQNGNKALNMLGLATKAGQTVTGDEGCRLAIKRGKAKLVLIAQDASDNTKKTIKKLCLNYETKYIEFSTKDDLGQFSGKTNRAVVAIVQNGFAKAIHDIIVEKN